MNVKLWNRMKGSIIILTLCFASVYGQSGPCPQLSDAKPLNFDKFTGTWYILADSRSYAGYSQCGKMVVNKINDYKLNFTHSWRHLYAPDYKYTYQGDLIPMASSKRIFNFVNEDGVDRRYWVVGTDYEIWTLLYSCTQSPISHSVAGFLLSRQNSEQCLSMQQKFAIKQIMKKIKGWQIVSFNFHNQHDCKYVV